MKSGYVALMVLAVALASAAMTYKVVSSRAASDPHPQTQAPATARPLVVTAQPTMREFTVLVPWIGMVEAQASVELVPLIAGRVTAIEAQDQAPVEANTLLMKIGGPQVKSQRARLKANVEALKSQLTLAAETVQLVEENVKTQLASRDQLAAARTSHVALQGQLAEAEATLQFLESQVEIVAPCSGVFTNRRVSVGQEVAPNQPVGEILSRNHLRIEASLFPLRGAQLQGKEATVRLGGERTLTCVIARILPQAGSTGSVRVWIEGSQIDAQLTPGETASGEVVTERTEKALAVPASAVVYDEEERPYVFVQRDGDYEQRAVTLGVAQDDWVEVRSGLKMDETVATQGAYELFYREFNRQFKVED